MNITVNHNLATDEAKKRILKLADELKKDYGDKISDYSESWSGNSADISLKVMNMKVKGKLDILSDNVTMNGKVPLMAKPFQGQIETLIRAKLSELLA